MQEWHLGWEIAVLFIEVSSVQGSASMKEGVKEYTGIDRHKDTLPLLMLVSSGNTDNRQGERKMPSLQAPKTYIYVYIHLSSSPALNHIHSRKTHCMYTMNVAVIHMCIYSIYVVVSGRYYIEFRESAEPNCSNPLHYSTTSTQFTHNTKITSTHYTEMRIARIAS